MCLYPRLITNPKYKPNKKNGGHPPKPKDARVTMVPIGCGQCQECRNQLANTWKTRLGKEIEKGMQGYMVTLTFSEEWLNYLKEEDSRSENEIATTAVRRFLERWRKETGKSLRHWLITELGHENTERIHLHGIVWTNEPPTMIGEKWKYGFVRIGNYVNEQTVNYIVKYVTKVDNDHPNYKAKILTSAGIGNNAIQPLKTLCHYNGKNTKEYAILKNGTKTNLPIYYRNHIYTEEQREKLWLNRLDKEERFITGTKYYVRNKQEKNIFIKALKEAQKTSERNGYIKPEWKSDTYMKTLKKLKKS